MGFGCFSSRVSKPAPCLCGSLHILPHTLDFNPTYDENVPDVDFGGKPTYKEVLVMDKQLTVIFTIPARVGGTDQLVQAFVFQAFTSHGNRKTPYTNRHGWEPTSGEHATATVYFADGLWHVRVTHGKSRLRDLHTSIKLKVGSLSGTEFTGII